MNRFFAISLGLIVFTLVFSFLLLPALPPELPIHWGPDGEPDLFVPAVFVLLYMPMLALGILGMFMLVPRIAANKRNLELFRPYYNMMALMLTLFFLIIHYMTLAFGLGYELNFLQGLTPMAGFMYYYISILFSRAKKNMFIGIRTPWTMSSSRVWDATHRMGSRVFKVVAVVTAVGLFFPEHGLWFILVPVIVATIMLIVYSYYYWKRVNA